jgi:hypothetical protein
LLWGACKAMREENVVRTKRDLQQGPVEMIGAL